MARCFGGRDMKKFLQRLVVTVIGIPLAVVAIFFCNDLLFSIIVAVLIAIMASEYCDLMEVKGIVKLPWIFMAVATFMLSTVALADSLWSAPLCMLAVFTVIFLGSELLDRKFYLEPTNLLRFAVYVSVLPSFLVAIRSIPGHVEIGGLSLSKGPVLLLVFLVTIWAIDITAYLIGSRIKSAKLCPDVSAGKTIGGSVAGFVAALAFAIAFAMTLHNPFLVLLGPVIGLLGQVGDLVESFLKRNFKKKDSGDLLPGHGGILDRLDSMIYAAPIAYIILSLVG